jgi:hypothetical protein
MFGALPDIGSSIIDAQEFESALSSTPDQLVLGAIWVQHWKCEPRAVTMPPKPGLEHMVLNF